jgi:PAT family beta-lactamase induction signal transducer AmpG
VSLRRKLAVIALVYVIEGFPMGVFTDVWPVYFRRLGISITEIGLFSGLSFAWSLKLLWSPLVDRFGERRMWIVGAMLAMGAALLLLAGLEPGALTPLVWLLLAGYCLASATQDVAIDAYTIGLVDPGEEGPANAMRNTAYRVGMVALANGLLFLPRWIGWTPTLACAGALSVALAASVLLAPRIEVPRAERRALWGPLRRWLGREGAVTVLLFVLLYRVGDSAMAPMVKPFWVDRGFSNEEIASVSGLVGMFATIAGAWTGGDLVARRGIGPSLWLIGALALASNLVYALAAALPSTGHAGVYAASVTESFCGGMAGVAFMSFLMRICQREHAAVQYALLTAIYNLAGSLLRIPSGALAEALGYAGYFALTAAFALPAFAFLPGARRWLGADSR